MPTDSVPGASSEAPPRPGGRGPHAMGWFVGLAVVAVATGVVLVVMLVVGGRDRDDFTITPTSDLVRALQAHDLQVCSNAQSTGTHSYQAVSTQVLAVASPGDCGDSLDLQLDTFRTKADRNAAALNAEGVSRGRSAGTVWTWHQYTIYLQADDSSGDPGVRDRIVDAVSSVGAE